MMPAMATKKGKKRVAKKSTSAKKAKKGRPLARPKKAAAGGTKRSAARSPKKSAARKAATRKTTPKKRVAGVSSGAARTPVKRRDRPGHIDPNYAAELRGQSGTTDRDPLAFIETARGGGDDLAEERGEEVIEKATTGEDEAEEMLDQVVPEEQGGPFVETNAGQEFAYDTDLSNPKGAKREPFPTT